MPVSTPLRFTSVFDLLKLRHLFRWRSDASQNAAAEISRYSTAFAFIVYFRLGEIYNIYRSLNGTNFTALINRLFVIITRCCIIMRLAHGGCNVTITLFRKMPTLF